MKVLFLSNIPVPYRVAFFNELGKFCNLTVLFELDKSTNRNKNWLTKKANNFNLTVLNSLKLGSSSGLSFEIIKYLVDKSYDIIVVGGYNTPTGMLAIKYLKYKNIPFILNADGGFIKKDNIIKKTIKKYFIGSASAWLSSGAPTTNYLIHYGAKKNNIYLFPFSSVKENDVVGRLFDLNKKNILKNSLNINEDKVVVSVGSFIHRKGFDVLLYACTKLNFSIGVYIIGGEPTAEYIKIKKKYGLDNVHFIGFKNRYELSRYYQAADLFVLPTREDIWGLVINEAMAHGLPIITTNKCVAGIELVKDLENGFIVPANDPEVLYHRIIDIIENDHIIDKMSINSLNLIRRYTIENMATIHYNIFKKYLGEF